MGVFARIQQAIAATAGPAEPSAGRALFVRAVLALAISGLPNAEVPAALAIKHAPPLVAFKSVADGDEA